ncbi:MAG: hypothetical protein QM778_34280 [Myxococcales bacterium]
MNQKELAISTMVLALGALGCSSDTTARQGALPWDDGHTQVVGPNGEVVDVATPEGDGCLKVGEEFADPANCIKPQDECESRAADVLLDTDGKVLDTLCYPAEGTISVAQLEASDGGVAQNQNNSVIVLDSNPDVDVAGDLSVDANNVYIYGDSPDTSVVDGDLTLDGNNAVVRGVRITGDVTVVKNDATFFYCVIEGNLTITGNNTVIAGCDVLGTLTIMGNNSKLVGNHLVHAPEIDGKGTQCDANLSAEDKDQSGTLEDSELGAPIQCGEKGK